MGAVSGQKVVLHTVATRLMMQTNGIDATEIVLDLPPGDMAGYGPYLTSITAHVQADARTANFQWKVVSYWSIDGVNWSTASDVFAYVSTGTPSIQAPFTDVAKLGIKMRYALVCKPSSGTAREQAFVTCVLAFEFKT